MLVFSQNRYFILLLCLFTMSQLKIGLSLFCRLCTHIKPNNACGIMCWWYCMITVSCEGPSLDTIVLQHYLLRQRVLMRAKPRKGGQIRFTNEQSVCLETHFCRQKYLSPTERKGIANELGLSERQIKTWFQNRRAKWRRCKQLEEEEEQQEERDERQHLRPDRHHHRGDDQNDRLVLCNKHKDMHSWSRDSDNDDHCDRYHPSNSSQHWHRWLSNGGAELSPEWAQSRLTIN